MTLDDNTLSGKKRKQPNNSSTAQMVALELKRQKIASPVEFSIDYKNLSHFGYVCPVGIVLFISFLDSTHS